MNDGWRIVTIGKLCNEGGGSVQTGPFGSQLHASDYVIDGIPFIMPANLGENKVIENDIARISNSDYQRLAKYQLKQGDIIYGRRGDIGRRALITAKEEGWMLGSGCLWIRFGDADVDPRYVSYYLGLPEVKQQVLGKAVGTTMPNLNSAIIRSVPLPLPPLPTQHRIASILGALDDKIECNRRINQTLEQMAQALYKHWFVDFAPFRGEGMVESGLGEIPKGWQVGTFGDIVSIDSRVINPQKFLDEEFLHLSIPAFDNERRPSAERGKKILSGKFLIDTNCVLVSKLNPRIYRVWTIFPKVQLRSITSTEFIPYVPKQGIAWAFLNCHVRDKRFIQDFESHATGTTGSRQRVRPERTLSFPCVVPPKDALKQFEQIAGTYWIQIDRNSSENESLTVTRDYLLPKLMSGEIEIKSVDQT